MNNELLKINEKLKDIELRAKGSSEAMKGFLRVGYKLLLEKRKRLVSKLEQKSAETLF